MKRLKIFIVVALGLFSNIEGLLANEAHPSIAKTGKTFVWGLGLEISGLPYAYIDGGFNVSDSTQIRLRTGGSVLSMLFAIELMQKNILSTWAGLYMAGKSQVLWTDQANGLEIGLDFPQNKGLNSIRLGVFKGRYKSELESGKFTIPTFSYTYRY